jgi:hypothetical protein
MVTAVDEDWKGLSLGTRPLRLGEVVELTSDAYWLRSAEVDHDGGRIGFMCITNDGARERGSGYVKVMVLR